MSWLGDVADFESFNLGEMWNKIKKDPERIFIGAADPFSSNVWGKILGKDYEPIVDQYGGASKDVYGKAEAKGINTGPGSTMHGIARTIASLYAGGAASKGMGSMMSSQGGAAGGTGLLANGGQSAAGMGGGTGLTYGSAGQGMQLGSTGMSSAAPQSGGLLGSMQTASQYMKTASQAAQTASSVQGLLAEPERAPIQEPQMIAAGAGPEALAALAAQNQQSIDQSMQLAAQQRAQRRNMYRGNF